MNPGGASFAFVALLAAAAAPVDDPQSLPVMRLEPTGQDVAEVIRDVQPGRSTPAGDVELRCETKHDNALDRCEVLKETPSGGGLGDMALRLASFYRASAPGPLRVIISFKAYETAQWRRKPTPRMLEAAVSQAGITYPNGSAVLTCETSPEGALKACRVDSSEPNERYGRAAMLLMPYFKLRGATYGGEPVVSWVRIPVSFTSG